MHVTIQTSTTVANSIVVLLPILRTISHDFQFNSSTESSLSKCLFETAHSAFNAMDVDALKFRVVQYIFYNGQIQQDNSVYLMLLIRVIDKRSVRYDGSNDNIVTGFL